MEEENTSNDVNLNDIIKEQQTTIKTLVDNIQNADTKTQDVQSPIYWTTPQKTEENTPNYVMYIAIGLGVYFLLRKGK